jgi:hypothetical protein
MLLVDTSGSMEKLLDCDCTTPGCTECLPNCKRGDRNRFADLLEALTGTWKDFSCKSLERTAKNGASFDLDYYLPYNRPPYDEPQRSDGLLDKYRTRVRFGMATFDGNDTYTGAEPLVPETKFDDKRSEAEDGMWSYGSTLGDVLRTRPGDEGVGTFSYPYETLEYRIDTGVRGPKASNGRLMHARVPSEMAKTNDAIQRELLRTRPFRGTPTAAALDDLHFYFVDDPKVAAEMHDQREDRHVIFITDGYPDDDYRSFGCNCREDDPSGPNQCGGAPNGPVEMHCPYPTAEEAAAALVADGVASVHVVAMGPTERQVVDRDHSIAQSGNTRSAYIVENKAQLSEALTDVVEEILGE